MSSGATSGVTPLDVLAIGAHPDDVELGCGATLALLARAGLAVGILHLTRGEAGTRGTPETRRREAEAAARALGAKELLFLDCGDGALRTGTAEEDELIRVLRRHRPELVFGPTPADRHPDHGRAHRLVEAAAFYAGLAGRPGISGELAPHRPALVLSYMQHDLFTPSLIVDVTDGWEAKEAALAAYRSQLHQGGDGGGEGGDDAPAEPIDPEPVDTEPATKVASEEFRRAVEGRAHHFGLMISAAYGEAFTGRLPVAVPRAETLMDLLPGGLR